MPFSNFTISFLRESSPHLDRYKAFQPILYTDGRVLALKLPMQDMCSGVYKAPCPLSTVMSETSSSSFLFIRIHPLHFSLFQLLLGSNKWDVQESML